jgi:hypothetical protein
VVYTNVVFPLLSFRKKRLKKLILLLFFALPVQAQVVLEQEMYCVDGDTLVKTITEFQEKPIIQFLSSRPLTGTRDVLVEVPAVLYVNHETQTWTLVEKPSEDMFCIVAHGQGINIFDDKRRRI